jgi:hypothetical protein
MQLSIVQQGVNSIYLLLVLFFDLPLSRGDKVSAEKVCKINHVDATFRQVLATVTSAPAQRLYLMRHETHLKFGFDGRGIGANNSQLSREG